MDDADKLVSLFQLPPEAMLDRALPKTFFTREFELTPSEKKLLSKPYLFEKITWKARLRLNTVNVPPYQSKTERFIELQIFTIEIKQEMFSSHHLKVEQLFFKYIPYPLILIASNRPYFHISFANHHINPNQAGSLVVDKIYRIKLPMEMNYSEWAIHSLHLGKQSSIHLKSLYHDFLKNFVALEISALTNKMCKLNSQDQMREAYELLEGIKRCKREMKTIRKSIVKTTHMNDRIELGTKIHQLKTQIQSNLKKLNEF